MSQLSSGLSREEKQSSSTPLAVPPREASRLLSVGISTVYNLMNTGELQNYRDGKKLRRITMESICDYIARRVAAGGSAGTGAARRWPRKGKTPAR